MTIIFVEGDKGGKSGSISCREAFRRFFAQIGLPSEVRIVASGGRGDAWNKFQKMLPQNKSIVLLVDSEVPVTGESNWGHVKTRDNWAKPKGAEEKHLAFMVPSMEAWIIADSKNLKDYFGRSLGKLPPTSSLESKTAQDLVVALETATSKCGKSYSKGAISFELLSNTQASQVKDSLPHATQTFETVLNIGKS